MSTTAGVLPPPRRRGESSVPPEHQQGRAAGPSHYYPANNPVLRPPVAGRVGLWSKTDSTSYFKDFEVRDHK
jgi:hypothetical protein